LTFAAASAAAASATPSPAEQRLAGLAAQVAQARAEVETLADELGRERAASRERIFGLERRRADLEQKLAELRLVRRQLEAQQAQRSADVDAVAASAAAARAPVRAALTALAAHVEAVPFRGPSRSARIAALRDGLEARPALASAVALWPIVAEEAALLMATGRVKQGITLPDQSRAVAEVAHLGPFVFFRLDDGRVGHVDGGAFVVVDAPDVRAQIGLVFERLKRERLDGVFLVPLPASVTSAAPLATESP
jgi:hypothetical protein